MEEDSESESDLLELLLLLLLELLEACILPFKDPSFKYLLSSSLVPDSFAVLFISLFSDYEE